MSLDVLTSIFLVIAATSMAFRESLLSPWAESFPKAPAPVRLAIFAFAAAMAAGAVLFAGAAQQPGNYAGSAAVPVMMFALGVALYDSVMLVNLLTHRYPPEVWRRLNRAAETVRRSCPELKGRFRDVA